MQQAPQVLVLQSPLFSLCPVHHRFSFPPPSTRVPKPAQSHKKCVPRSGHSRSRLPGRASAQCCRDGLGRATKVSESASFSLDEQPSSQTGQVRIGRIWLQEHVLQLVQWSRIRRTCSEKSTYAVEVYVFKVERVDVAWEVAVSFSCISQSTAP